MTSYLMYRVRKWGVRAAIAAVLGIPLSQHAFGFDIDWKHLTNGATQILGLVGRDAEPVGIKPPEKALEYRRGGTVEVAFSPNHGAEELVLKVVKSARSHIDVMAYSFTSVTVSKALIAAKKQGIKVRLIADEKHNLNMDDGSSRRGRAALSALANAGIQVNVTSQFAIHHDKVIMVDGKHLQTGSFNYSASARSRNSENVLVLWNSPDVVAAYETHFQRNLAGSKAFVPY